MRLHRTEVLAVALPCILLMSPIGAQEIGVARPAAGMEEARRVAVARNAPEWGTATYGVRTVQALGFQEGVSENQPFSYLANNHRHRIGGTTSTFHYSLTDLPAGALITGLELQACDTNVGSAANVSLLFMTETNSAFSLGSVTTGFTETPGCFFFGGVTNLSTMHTVDNFNNAYFLRVGLGTDDTTSFGAVRVYYRLQVSPAPATATFPNDVPTTHPFFRFVEALAAAGITSGCGAGSYCPDDPVTRGQMAVFLSAALGLHFQY